ncbi:PD40 domain-containing protein [Anaerobacillus sp. CMMVII]|uniref:TolB family protein n=1 Tax=Anaerobacillus sp. CMMVII TaxID=2755588 RepID=UPI0021B794B4|nr:translocation protein TolB [Anaerobacillus sp. CMMVII]MCT8136745.1 PD40 domain-containing protein [Anaerobacillus sp. CMMVII]
MGRIFEGNDDSQMKKILCFLLILLAIVPSIAVASKEQPLKAAFVRNDDLWVKIGEDEKQITNGDYIRYPKWSYDGSWIAYLKGEKSDFPFYEGELWLYNLSLEKHIRLSETINRNFQWSPNKNAIAFQSRHFLYKSDEPSFNLIYPIGSGINNFSWLPSGEGVLTSTKTGSQLDADILLSKVFFDGSLNEKITQPLYTIPVSKEEYFITTSSFQWSDDQQWLAFLLTPTASASADSNTLSILSADGKTFMKMDEMLNYEEWLQWAPSKSLLGYIGGGVREATRNKKVKVLNVLEQSSKVYTPKGFVDRDFTWLTEHLMITSRALESEWVEVNQRPLPALYKINLLTNEQTKVTFPLQKQGDFYPQYSDGQLIWIRTDRRAADVWIANPDGSNSKKWIQNLDVGSGYYEKWDWGGVFEAWGRF